MFVNKKYRYWIHSSIQLSQLNYVLLSGPMTRPHQTDSGGLLVIYFDLDS